MLTYLISIREFWEEFLSFFPDEFHGRIEAERENIIRLAFDVAVIGGYVQPTFLPTLVPYANTQDPDAFVEMLEEFLMKRMDFILSMNITDDYDVWALHLVHIGLNDLEINFDSKYSDNLQLIGRYA